MKVLAYAVVGFLLVQAVTAEILGWGYQGHAACARIAQHYLTDAAKEAALALLPEVDGDIAAIASWADDVRKNLPWSAALHYIDIPDWACNYNYTRDCHDELGAPDRCVDGAIQNYTRRLDDASLPVSQRVQALKFVVHFIGDIHQPLHVSFIGDRGGNDINGTYFGAVTNLHAIWDYGTIEQRLRRNFNSSEPSWTEYLIKRIEAEWKDEVAKWRSCGEPQKDALFDACSSNWAHESVELCCKYGYRDVDGSKITKNFVLGEEYYQHTLPTIEYQIAKCGVRLAHVLNSILRDKDDSMPNSKKVAIALGTSCAALALIGCTLWCWQRRKQHSPGDYSRV